MAVFEPSGVCSTSTRRRSSVSRTRPTVKADTTTQTPPEPQGSPPMLKRLARPCSRRRWRVLGAWVVFLVVVSFVSSAAGGVFRNEFSLSGSESKQAQQLLKERGFG